MANANLVKAETIEQDDRLTYGNDTVRAFYVSQNGDYVRIGVELPNGKREYHSYRAFEYVWKVAA